MNEETRATVLVVDDDPALTIPLADELWADGYAVALSSSVAEAAELLATAFPDVAVVDVGLPDGSGHDLVRRVRGHGPYIPGIDPGLPMLVLSGRCSESDRVRAFECGADDFLAKPYSYRELRGRLSALLKRREGRGGHGSLRAGPLSIDITTREVYVGSTPLRLTQKEFILLHTLAGEPRRVFTKNELLRSVWGFRAPEASRTRTLDSHACRLRAKLAAAGAGDYIENVWGVGYRLCALGEMLEPAA